MRSLLVADACGVREAMRCALCGLWCCEWLVGMGFSYLDETDVGALLAEALTADVEAVLSDETSRVGADAAVAAQLALVLCHRFPSPCAVASGAYHAPHVPIPQTFPVSSSQERTYHSREPLP